MSDAKEKIFVNGLYSNEVADSAPNWVLGKGSIHIEKLKKFLYENEKYAVNGYLEYTILRSKEAGNRYIELDLYKFHNPKPATPKDERFNFKREDSLPVVDVNQDINVEDIPF